MFPVSFQRAQSLCERLTKYYQDSDLLFTPREYGHDGWYVYITKPDLPSGILMSIHDVDNGAAGYKTSALERINAFRDELPYEAPQPTGLVYDDVMTLQSLPEPEEVLAEPVKKSRRKAS